MKNTNTETDILNYFRFSRVLKTETRPVMHSSWFFWMLSVLRCRAKRKGRLAKVPYSVASYVLGAKPDMDSAGKLFGIPVKTIRKLWSDIKIILKTKKARHKAPMDTLLRKTPNLTYISAHFQRVSTSNINPKGGRRSHTCPAHIGKLREGR